MTGVYLLSHWSKVSHPVVNQFQSNSYKNCNDDEKISSCKCMKELFLNSFDPTLIKRVEDNYEVLYGLE